MLGLKLNHVSKGGHCTIKCHSPNHFKASSPVKMFENFCANFSFSNFGYLFRETSNCHHILRTIGPIIVKWKRSKFIGYWADFVTSILDYTHDIYLWIWKVKLFLIILFWPRRYLRSIACSYRKRIRANITGKPCVTRCVTDSGGWFLWRFYSCTLLQ